MPICFLCRKHFTHLRDIWRHFKFAHKLHAHSTFRCAEYNCTRTFNIIKAYRRHWILCHNNDGHSNSNSCTVEISPSSSSTHASHPVVKNISSSSVESPVVSEQKESVPIELCDYESIQLGMLVKDDVLQFVGNLYSMPSLPRSSVQTIIASVQSIMSDNMERLYNNIKNKLQNVNVPSDVVVKALEDVQQLKNAFDGVDTEFKRLQILKAKGWFHPPIPYVVGERFKRNQSNAEGHVQMRSVEVKAQFFPLRKMFKTILEIPRVYDKIREYKLKLLKEKNVLSNFVQGSLWQSKIQNMTDKEVFPLFVFFDDYETGNALGSHAGTNKLGGVYVSIPCFPPEYRSTLNSIYHAILFYSNDRQEFGNTAIFGILIDELRFLQNEGIELDLPQGKTVVYFKLGLVIGDNLGLHSLLGFVESFNANYSCRFCKMNKVDRAQACVEVAELLRDTDSYNEDLLLNNVSLTGIKEKCALLELEDFHPCDNLSVDIMHDMLEGVCKFDMIEIIKYLTQVACFFTLDDLNSRLISYDYGIADATNKPPKLSQQHINADSIHMSAAEMWTFVRHFGVLCGDLVPEGDPVWRFYLLLCQILALLTSTSIQTECIVLLRVLIQEHHTLYIKLFAKNLKPKAHHMLHYPKILAACGPLVHLWCMRFEANHKPSKHGATVSNSKRNVVTTVALKQQLKLANVLASGNIFSDTLEIGPGRDLTLAELSLEFQDTSIDLTQILYFVKWVKKYGILYKPGMVVCVGEDDGIPEFAIVQHIYMIQDEILFICKEIETMLIQHVHAYEVCARDFHHKIFNLKGLLHHLPSHITKMSGNEFIILHSSI